GRRCARSQRWPMPALARYGNSWRLRRSSSKHDGRCCVAPPGVRSATIIRHAPLSPMTVATNFLWFHACVATETALRLVRRQSSRTGRRERHCDRDTVPTTICAPSERDEAEQLTESHTAA